MEKRIRNQIHLIQPHFKIVLYIALGILWSFSQVGYSLGFLTWFTLVPFLFFIKYENMKKGFFYSWLFGFSAYLVHFWWMPAPVADVLATVALPKYLFILGWATGIFINLLVCLYHGLVYALIFLISKFCARKSGRYFYLIFALAGTVLDVFFPKLWYDLIGHSQYIFFKFSQIADIFGVPLITLLVLACNVAIIQVIEAVWFKKNREMTIAFFSLVMVLIIGSSLYGWFRYNQVKQLIAAAPKARIGMVQGNYSGLDKRQGKTFEMIDTYNKYSTSLLEDDPDLIVWPESAIPVLYDSHAQYYKSIKKFNDVPLLFGLHLAEDRPEFHERQEDGTADNGKKEPFSRRKKVYNSLVLTTSDAVKVSHYHKIKLLPFVEEFPLKFLNEILHFINLSEFSRGTGPVIMQTGKIRFSPNICYEAIIPSFVRKSLNIDGVEANLIINCTNDSWFGKTIEPGMHLHIAGFRSIENRKSLVRVTCTGYSAVFDPGGAYKRYENTSSPSPLYEPWYEVQEVPLMEIMTVYRSGGWMFRYVLLAVVALLFCIALFRRIRFNSIRSRIIAERHHKRALYNLWLYK